MLLEHRFSVPAPLDRVWAAVIDPKRVAPCVPGATLTDAGDAGFSGSVKVKIGSISLLYKGSGQFLETDEQARRLVIKASGKDSRDGTASATVTLTLSADDDTNTTGTVTTDLTVTGKPTQFDRDTIAEVGGKILDTFAACLGTTLTGEARTPTAAASQPQPVEDAEPEPPAPPKPATRRRTGSKSTASAKNSATPTPETTTADKSASEKPVAEKPAGAAPVPALPTVNAAETESATAPRLQLVDTPPASPETEPVDLLDYAGPSIAKRAIPALLGLLVLIVVVRRLRRRDRGAAAG